MATLSSANTKYTAEQLTKATGISAETLATWGLTEATDTLTMSQLAEIASSDAQAKKVLEKIVAQNAQTVASGKVVASNASLVASETSATLATGSFTTAIKANIAAMWTWMTTTPLGWLTLLAAGIFAAVKAYDALTVSAEEASDKIEESRSAYEETTSTIESMNSELETTRQKINELELKGTLSFTDKAELDNLKKQNDELERSIALYEKKSQNEAKQTVSEIIQNKDTLDKDFDKKLNILSNYQKEYEDFKENGINAISNGSLSLDVFESNLAGMDKTMSQYESDVLDKIEEFEQYKQDIINKYNTDDVTAFKKTDRDLYNNITRQLQEAYKLVYSDSEYNKFVIEPIFNKEDFKGLQDELLSYFISGGQTDLSSLEEKFGSDIITALRSACEKAGIDFNKMIDDMYANSQTKLNKIAPLIESPNNAYDAQRKQVSDYIRNILSEEDRTILLNAEIPDEVKLNTIKEVNDFITEIRNSFNNVAEGLSITDAITKVNGDDNTLGIIGELNGVKEILSDVGNVSIETYEKMVNASVKYSSALKVESGRLVVDSKRLQQVSKQRTKEIKQEVKEASTLKKIQWIAEAKRLQQYRFQQNDLTDSIWETCDSLMEEITKFDMLTQGIDAASNAFVNFKAAQEAGESGDYYDTATEMADAYKKALESGKIGTEEFMATMQGFMSADQFGKILALDDRKAQLAELDKFYDDIVSRWFTVDSEDGTYDVSGVENFMQDVSKVVDEEGKNLFATYENGIFKLVDGVKYKDIADYFNISLDSLYSVFGELEEYSIGDSFTFTDVDTIDGYYTRLSEVTEARKAYNEALANGDEYNVALAQFKLNQATDNYGKYIEQFNTQFSELKKQWSESGDGKTFSDYLGLNENEILVMDSVIQGQIDKLITQKTGLEKAFSLTSNESEKSNIAKQLNEVNKELADLKSNQTILQDDERYTKAIGDATEDTVTKMGEYNNLIKQLNDKEKKWGKQELEETTQKAAELITELGSIPDSIKIQLEVESSGLESEIASIEGRIKELQTAQVSLPTNAYGAQNAIQSSINYQQQSLSEKQSRLDTIKSVLELDTNSAMSQLSSLQEAANVTGTVDVDDQASGKIDEAQGKLDKFNSTVATATANVNGNAESITNSVLSALDKIDGKTVNATINVTKNGDTNVTGAGDTTGTGGAYGTVNIHSNGRAYANGNIGTNSVLKNTMVSEVKPEMVINPKDGTYTIYDRPTMIDLPKDAIVFNGDQTEQILKNGHASSFGKAYVNGNVDGHAFANEYYGSGSLDFGASSKRDKRSRTRGGRDVEDVVDETTEDIEEASEEIFDWIERKVKKLQRLFERWTNNAEKTFSKDLVGTYYKKASSNLTQQLDTQEKAYSRYLAEAEKSPISDDYKKKIKDGAIDIETIIEEAADNGDKTLADHINNYQTYYDKSIDSLTAFEEAAEKKFNIPIEKAARKVELFKNQIDLLNKKIDNAIGATNKNKLIDKQIKQQERTLKTYKNTQKSTTKAVKTQSKNMISSSVLKSSDVSKAEKKSIKKSVKNGKELDLTMFQEGSKAYLQAVKYNEAIRANTQATLDYKNAVEEYTSAVREAAKTKFDNIATDFENKITLLEHKVTNIDNQISNIEARGLTAGKSYYTSQKQINADQLAYYQQEKASLENYIANIEEGTEDWYDAKSKIQECANNIATCEQNVYKLNDSIRNVDITKFELIEKQISAISDEADFLNGLIGNDPLFDEDKVMTNAGLATLGNYAVQYYSSKSNASNDKAEIERLQKILNDGTWASNNFNSAKQVQDRIDELYGTWQGHINDLNSAQKSIYDLMNQELDNQLDKIKELIEAKKEELEAEKDLHDYQNTISEKTKDIATLQKQIAAYSGNTSQEGQAKLQKLQASLNDKQKDLRDTEYDKYISDQEDILDRLLKELEEANKKQLNDFMKLVQEGLNLANSNIDTIDKTIQEYSELYGYKPQYVSDFRTDVSGIGEGIKNKIDEVITAIEAKANESVVEPSETPTAAKVPENAKNTDGTPKNDGISQPVIGGNNNPAAVMLDKVTTNKSEKKTIATNYINKKAKKRKDKKSDIKYDVNKRLWDVNGKKTLTTAQLKELAKKLGVKDTKFDKSGALYKKLHSLKVLGFANGGIVRDELEGKIKKNGDSLLASINPNETVLTEKFTNLMPDAVDMMSKFVKVDIPDVSKFITPISQPTTIDSHIDINLPNVENGVDFIAELKKPKVQKALQSVTTDLLAGGSKLGINRFK